MQGQATGGAAYGWRARIGFITPSPGVENNAYEFYHVVPPGVVAVLTSLGVLGLSQDQYDLGLSRLPFALEEMVRRGVNVAVQAGVPLVVTHGWGYYTVFGVMIAKRLQNVPPAIGWNNHNWDVR